MNTRLAQRLRWPSVSAAAATLLTLSAGALGQDADLASVPELELEAGPPRLPGREEGPRVRPTPTPPTPAPEPTKPEPLPEWFGGLPYWMWTRATGNWGGWRDDLDARGLTIAGSYTLDWSSVWDGGVRRGASTRSVLDINATLDLEKAVGLAGGTLFADFYSSDMRGGFRDAGDVMGIYNTETVANVDQVAEAWYQQVLFDGLLRVKAGKIDALNEFNVLLSAAYQLHTTAAVGAAMLSFPTWPDPAMGACVFLYPTATTYLGAGFFDGSLSAGKSTGRHGPRDLWHGNEYYFIGEAGLTWNELGSLGHGRLAAGGWVNTGRYTRFDTTTQRTSAGGYFLIEQQILRRESCPDDNDKGLFLWGRFGRADDAIATVGHHLALGGSIHGTFEGRDDDAAGFLISWGDLSDDPAAGLPEDETAYEVFYRFAITPFLSITPDLQLITNPGGTGTIDDALVGGVRVEISF